MHEIKIPDVLIPFRLYKNTIMVSVDSTEEGKVDFLMQGDVNQIVAALCVLMQRHDILKQVVYNAAATHHYAQTHKPPGHGKRKK